MKLFKIITLITLLFVELQQRVFGINLSFIHFGIAVLLLMMVHDIIRSKTKIQVMYLEDRHLIIASMIYMFILTIIIVYHNQSSVSSVIKYIMVLALGQVSLYVFWYKKNKEKDLGYITYFNVLLLISIFIILFGVYEVSKMDIFPKRFDSFLWGRSNRMATRFLIILPISFFLAKYKNRVYYIPFFILTLGILMTVSRGAILVLAFFILLNIKEFLKRKNFWIVLTGVLSNVLLMFQLKLLHSFFYRSTVLQQQIVNEVKKQASNNAGGESISRLVLWKHGIETFFTHPIIGEGIDKYSYYYMYNGEKVAEVNAHNWIIHVLSEIGLLGFAATAIFITAMFYILIKRYKTHKELQSTEMLMIIKIAIWVLTIYLLHNLVEASASSIVFGYGNVSVFVLIILGICLQVTNQSNV